MKKHILVIDDEAVITQMLASLLALSSYKVTIALDGCDGIKLYRQDPPDLVIVDMFMPGVDGLEVIKTITDEFPDARFIALSGVSSRNDLLAKARALGVQYTLEKPVKNKTLLAAIADLLGFQT